MKKLTLNASLIAPCGMNCAICLAYQREKNKCVGCRVDSDEKSTHCKRCTIVHCDNIAASKSEFCYECGKFPCRRLKQLDERYRKNYHMSMIENLEHIEKLGVNDFVKNEENRRTCKNCGSLICIHRENCLNCSEPWHAS